MQRGWVPVGEWWVGGGGGGEGAERTSSETARVAPRLTLMSSGWRYASRRWRAESARSSASGDARRGVGGESRLGGGGGESANLSRAGRASSALVRSWGWGWG